MRQQIISYDDVLRKEVIVGIPGSVAMRQQDWTRKMKLLAAALSLGTLLAAPAFVQPANAQRLDSTRERAIRECCALQKRDPHDIWIDKSGVLFHYRACMAERGQPE